MADIDIAGEDDKIPLMADEDKSNYPDTQAHPQTGRRRVLEGIRPCVAEMVGVAIFVFIGVISNTSDNMSTIAMAHGFTIMLLIMAFGNISGGHFNPCVTLGALLGGDISVVRSLLFLLAQLSGSILGAALTKGVLSDAAYTLMNAGIPDLGPASAEGPAVTVAQGILCEAVLTFVLVLTVLMTAVDREDKLLAPVAIGLVVTVGVSAASSVSGAAMNPARAFGPAVIGTSDLHSKAWSHHYVYWVGPIIGTLIAGALYRLLLASPHKRVICRD